MDYGVSSSQCGRIFSKTISMVAVHLQELVIWPDSIKIKQNLPLQFRTRFRDVESIIDCFEIEIEKPSNPIHQALTWSDYKKCNTLKYLISITPHGLINFISTGFGGRITDQSIVEQSGFLGALKPGCQVMADRGFKNIDKILRTKNCTLVRPPSVKTDQKLSKEEAKNAKQIASLRVHVERLIRRVREYRMCEPHACINTRLLMMMMMK